MFETFDSTKQAFTKQDCHEETILFVFRFVRQYFGLLKLLCH